MQGMIPYPPSQRHIGKTAWRGAAKLWLREKQEFMQSIIPNGARFPLRYASKMNTSMQMKGTRRG
jgi:hypothetical protein